MFLSKNPMAYSGFVWPSNTMQGLTLTKMDTVNELNAMMDIADMPRPFLSIEPLLGTVEGTIPFNFEKIIIGAMTGPGAVKVMPEWIDSIKKNIEPKRIFWKESLRKYL
jgi:protein gp37